MNQFQTLESWLLRYRKQILFDFEWFLLNTFLDKLLKKPEFFPVSNVLFGCKTAEYFEEADALLRNNTFNNKTKVFKKNHIHQLCTLGSI
jgi:hypothetical protein